MAATPARALQTENALKGQLWNENNVAAAINVLGSDFSPLSDVRASASYRLQVAGNLLRRAWLSSDSLPREQLTVTDYA